MAEKMPRKCTAGPMVVLERDVLGLFGELSLQLIRGDVVDAVLRVDGEVESVRVVVAQMHDGFDGRGDDGVAILDLGPVAGQPVLVRAEEVGYVTHDLVVAADLERVARLGFGQKTPELADVVATLGMVAEDMVARAPVLQCRHASIHLPFTLFTLRSGL